MRCIKNLVVVVAALVTASGVLGAQRRVNTGTAAPRRAWEIGIDPLTVEYGTDDPSYLALVVPGTVTPTGHPRPLVRAALYFAPAMAIDGRIGWATTVGENIVGRSAYAVDLGLMLGLTDLDPQTRAMYVRPGVMVSGSSLPGARSFTTLTGAFGLRRPWHALILSHEFQLNRQLESGPVAARLYADYHMGVTLRL